VEFEGEEREDESRGTVGTSGISQLRGVPPSVHIWVEEEPNLKKQAKWFHRSVMRAGGIPNHREGTKRGKAKYLRKEGERGSPSRDDLHFPVQSGDKSIGTKLPLKGEKKGIGRWRLLGTNCSIFCQEGGRERLQLQNCEGEGGWGGGKIPTGYPAPPGQLPWIQRREIRREKRSSGKKGFPRRAPWETVNVRP